MDFPPKLPLRGVGGHVEGTVGASLIRCALGAILRRAGASWRRATKREDGACRVDAMRLLRTLVSVTSLPVPAEKRQLDAITCPGVRANQPNFHRKTEQGDRPDRVSSEGQARRTRESRRFTTNKAGMAPRWLAGKSDLEP